MKISLYFGGQMEPKALGQNIWLFIYFLFIIYLVLFS